MKQQHIIFTLLMALMAVLTVGCQKDEGTVTLLAKIQDTMGGNAKVYIDGRTPCWHDGDEVYINNAAYPVTAVSGDLAHIENVESAKAYHAIFPASIVDKSSKSRNSSIAVVLPSMHTYRLVDGRQKVDMPMGAHLTGGNTLQFYNLCSIVRVTVHNQLDRVLPLGRIELRAKKAALSGSATATVSRKSSDIANMSNNAQNTVGLVFTTDCPATVEAHGTSTFDIVVPPFATDDVTLTLYTSDGYMCEMEKAKTFTSRPSGPFAALRRLSGTANAVQSGWYRGALLHPYGRTCRCGEARFFLMRNYTHSSSKEVSTYGFDHQIHQGHAGRVAAGES